MLAPEEYHYPAGLTLVIVREDPLGKAHESRPSILDYTPSWNDNDLDASLRRRLRRIFHRVLKFIGKRRAAWRKDA